MVGIDLGLVDYAGIGHQILQLGYLELQQSLGLLGGVGLWLIASASSALSLSRPSDVT